MKSILSLLALSLSLSSVPANAQDSDFSQGNSNLSADYSTTGSDTTCGDCAANASRAQAIMPSAASPSAASPSAASPSAASPSAASPSAASPSAASPSAASLSAASPSAASPSAASPSAADDGVDTAGIRTNPQLLGLVQPGVAPVFTQCEQSLKEVHDTIGNVKRVLADIIHEVERVQVYVFPTPVDMDPWMDPTMPWDYFYPTQTDPVQGTQSGQRLPARKKWMDYYGNHLAQLMPLLDSDVAAIIFPEGTQTQILGQLDVMKDTLKQLDSDYLKFKVAIQGPNYDNQDIARQAEQLHDDVCGVDVVRKHILKVVQGEQKEKAKPF